MRLAPRSEINQRPNNNRNRAEKRGNADCSGGGGGTPAVREIENAAPLKRH